MTTRPALSTIHGSQGSRRTRPTTTLSVSVPGRRSASISPTTTIMVPSPPPATLRGTGRRPVPLRRDASLQGQCRRIGLHELNFTTEIRVWHGEIRGAHASENMAFWLQRMVLLNDGDTVESQGNVPAAYGYGCRLDVARGRADWLREARHCPQRPEKASVRMATGASRGRRARFTTATLQGRQCISVGGYGRRRHGSDRVGFAPGRDARQDIPGQDSHFSKPD